MSVCVDWSFKNSTLGITLKHKKYGTHKLSDFYNYEKTHGSIHTSIKISIPKIFLRHDIINNSYTLQKYSFYTYFYIWIHV